MKKLIFLHFFFFATMYHVFPGVLMLDPETIIKFLKKQGCDLDNQWEDVAEESLKYDKKGEIILITEQLKQLPSAIQTAFNKKAADYKDKKLEKDALLSHVLKDVGLYDESHPSSLSTSVIALAPDNEQSLITIKSSAILEDLIKAIGDIVSNYFEEKYLKMRQNNGDTALLSMPLIAVWTDSTNDEIKISGAPGFLQDRIELKVAQKHEESGIFKGVSAGMQIIQNLFGPSVPSSIPVYKKY